MVGVGSVTGLLAKVPLVGDVLGRFVIRGWVRRLRIFGVDRAHIALAAERDAVVHLIQEVGFRKWSRYWHYGRTQISLTTRLFVEQVYSDLGDPWSQLITGFGPIKKIKGISMLASEKRRREKSAFKPSKRILQSATSLRRVRRQRAAKQKKQHFHGR